MKTTWARVGAGPPSRHTNPVPQTPHEQGSSRTTVPTRKPCTPDATQTRVGAGPPSRHTNPVAKTKSCPDEANRARVGAGPPSRHTSPFPDKAEYVQSKGGSRTTIPTHQPYALTKLQKKGGSGTTVPTHHPAKLRA